MQLNYYETSDQVLADKEKLSKYEWEDFSKGSGGSELAKIWNALNLTMHSVLYFQLKIPLERLNEEISEL